MSPWSSFDIPELASLILSYLDIEDLTRCARVSRAMHDICIPILWRSIDVPGISWFNDREFHRGLARYGKLYPVEHLRLTGTILQDFDMKLLAKNCTRLKHLDLSYTQFDAEDLRILIHSDPHGVLDKESSDRPKKRKAEAGSSIRRIRGSSQHTQDMAELVEYDDSGEKVDHDVNAMVRQYQQFLETNATPERVNQCTSVEASTTLDSKMKLVQSIGPVSVKSSALLDCAGSDHSAMFKTWFPFQLESLNFTRCYGLDGSACLEIVSLLGPQLKRLILNDIHSVKDHALIKLSKRCPNLVELQLERTGITDEFLKWFSRESLPSDATSYPSRQRRSLQRLSIIRNDVSSIGLISIIRACRSSVNTLSIKEMSLDDSVLFALVGNPAKHNTDKVPMAAPNSTAVVEHAIDHVPVITDRFSPNTVLTSINLSECGLIPDVGFQTLFRFATELAYIELGGCGLSDDALVVLAEAYRNRMKTLGFGVPAAWREYITADERAQAMDQMDSTKTFQDVSIASISSDHTDSSDHGSQSLRTGRVPGGLRRLLLSRCYKITNIGVRAILRSCVGLKSLDISDSRNLTLQLFQGPWACTKLTSLDMRGMILEVATNGPTTIYHEGTFTRGKEVREVREERLESSWRFPLAIAAYPEEDDYDKNGHYDHIVSPPDPCLDAFESEDSDYDQYETDGSADFVSGSDNDYEGSSGDEGSSIDDEGRRINRYWRERAAFTARITRHRVPREVRNNNPRQRAILRAFYSKLGHLTQLQTLDMGFCKFRVRVQDGLELVLPGLQRNLIEWNLDNEKPYRLLDPEMKFFGKYFGFDRDFAPETAVFQDGRRSRHERRNFGS
ncbi:hypothetical protein BGZ68_008642 [Mortierella alpina]|nr:hypothetical protein BGZ68_008642 [Mortierella alpina]